MRDGVVLRADVIRPGGDWPAPVILMRNPYGPIVARANLDPLRAVAGGFAVVMQSVRGTGASDGEFVPWAQEEADGYDSVAWCAAQAWSSGRVATYGPSYLGQAQLYAAAARHPAHVAMVPYVTPSHPYEVTYEDGALLLGSTFGWAFARAGDATDVSLDHPEPRPRRRLACLAGDGRGHRRRPRDRAPPQHPARRSPVLRLERLARSPGARRLVAPSRPRRPAVDPGLLGERLVGPVPARVDHRVEPAAAALREPPGHWALEPSPRRRCPR